MDHRFGDPAIEHPASSDSSRITLEGQLFTAAGAEVSESLSGSMGMTRRRDTLVAREALRGPWTNLGTNRLTSAMWTPSSCRPFL
jgi:hypothetical protein